MNGPNNLEHYITICKKDFLVIKDSSLLDPLVSYEDKEVLPI
jgi:hypothetical protein